MDELEIGKIGQYKGPFNMNETINITTNHNLQLGFSIGEKDAMHQLNSKDKKEWSWVIEPLIVKIDEQLIKIGQKCVYNPDPQIFHHTITFPYGAPASTIVDYIILE